MTPKSAIKGYEGLNSNLVEDLLAFGRMDRSIDFPVLPLSQFFPFPEKHIIGKLVSS